MEEKGKNKGKRWAIQPQPGCRRPTQGVKMGRLAVQDLEWAKARLVRLQQEFSFPAPPSQGPHRSIPKCKISKIRWFKIWTCRGMSLSY
jgi:hypothetical protein